MLSIVIAPLAQEDLRDQFSYYSGVADLALAERFLYASHATFIFLRDNPQIGRRRRFPGTNRDSVRSWRIEQFPNHLVFYNLDPDHGILEISRVLHGARDIENLFI